MTPPRSPRAKALVAPLLPCLALLAPLPLNAAEPASTPVEHVNHAGHAGHVMEPWMYEALRRRVDLYRTYTDAQIDESMVRMGPDYASYLSDTDTRGAVGVLVLAHGFGKVGDEAFRNGLRPVAARYPLAVAFGMSMTSSAHVQQALDELAAAGAFLSSLNIKEVILASLTPIMKETLEKVLWEIAPELAEKMLKEVLQGSIASLTGEVEKVIWETVPDLASSMISKEIEKIKSEF